MGRRGKGHLPFLIGGAEGIPEAVPRAAQLRLSLSNATLREGAVTIPPGSAQPRRRRGRSCMEVARATRSAD
ncbi:MAG: 23S rRNA (pseudouridine(1915)-N(3))-methyltransferase RlmH [Polyangiaceae bacterium]|nr:23S rRNA (pseudouridine(1915)-N(3))-methyltransferase RlmH [Polyangiaceae bacterium]